MAVRLNLVNPRDQVDHRGKLFCVSARACSLRHVENPSPSCSESKACTSAPHIVRGAQVLNPRLARTPDMKILIAQVRGV